MLTININNSKYYEFGKKRKKEKKKKKKLLTLMERVIFDIYLDLDFTNDTGTYIMLMSEKAGKGKEKKEKKKKKIKK